MFISIHRMPSANSVAAGDAARARYTRTAQALPRESRELRVHRLLCADRARSWIECARPRDHCNLESARQDIHNTFSAFDCVQMVDRLPWEDSEPCCGYGTVDH